MTTAYEDLKARIESDPEARGVARQCWESGIQSAGLVIIMRGIGKPFGGRDQGNPLTSGVPLHHNLERALVDVFGPRPS